MKEALAVQATHGLDGFTHHDYEIKVIRTATRAIFASVIPLTINLLTLSTKNKHFTKKNEGFR